MGCFLPTQEEGLGTVNDWMGQKLRNAKADCSDLTLAAKVKGLAPYVEHHLLIFALCCRTATQDRSVNKPQLIHET
eukprot:SAG11_NODE_334_length_10569_cov_9.662082_4_plen_76_part_00